MIVSFRPILVLLILCKLVWAQSTETIVPTALDSLQDSPLIGTAPSGTFEEQILETIRIEAVIEKPSVTLIQKRIETEIKNEPLPKRSFEKELSSKPEIVLQYGKYLESGKRIRKFKKVLDNDDK